jgi:hypothetical protein
MRSPLPHLMARAARGLAPVGVRGGTPAWRAPVASRLSRAMLRRQAVLGGGLAAVGTTAAQSAAGASSPRRRTAMLQGSMARTGPTSRPPAESGAPLCAVGRPGAAAPARRKNAVRLQRRRVVRRVARAASCGPGQGEKRPGARGCPGWGIEPQPGQSRRRRPWRRARGTLATPQRRLRRWACACAHAQPLARHQGRKVRRRAPHPRGATVGPAHTRPGAARAWPRSAGARLCSPRLPIGTHAAARSHGRRLPPSPSRGGGEGGKQAPSVGQGGAHPTTEARHSSKPLANP